MTLEDKREDTKALLDQLLREVHVIEVMETVEHDRVLELWGKREDAVKRVKYWREQRRRKVCHTVERIKWS